MKRAFALLCITLVFFSFYAAALSGRSARLNLAVRLGSASSDDGIVSQGNYISAEENSAISTTVLAIVSSGKIPETTNETYSSTAYLLYMNQSLENNRFLIAFTNGTNSTISSTIGLLGKRKMPAKTFTAAVPRSRPESFPTFVKLLYEDIDITSRVRWPAGPREIVIENEGKNSRGLSQISIKVIK